MHKTSLREQKRLYFWFGIALVAFALGLKIYILYFPFFFYHYLVPPGGDAINHLQYVNNILNGSLKADYPPLFHFVIAVFSKLSGAQALQTMKWVTPFLVILPSFALYIFSRRLFGFKAGVVAFFICLWVANYGLVAYGDGNYPNLLAGGFFQPISLTFIILALTKPAKKTVIWAILFSVLIALTHHLTTALYGTVLLVYFIVLLIWNRFEQIAPNIKRVFFVFLVLTGVVFVVVFLSPVRAVFESAIKSLFATGEVISSKNFAIVPNYHNYPEAIGGFVWYAGLIALLYLGLALGRAKDEVNKPAILLIICWFAVIFTLSRWQGVGLPSRIAREAGLPLTLAISYMLFDLLKAAKNSYQKIFAWSALSFVLVINLQQINGGAYMSPEFFNRMVWADESDLQKARVLEGLTLSTESIISNPTSPYMGIFTNRTFVYPNPGKISSPEDLISFAKVRKAKYVFIGKKTAGAPVGENAYAEFANFTSITSALNADKSVLREVEKFPDGSAIYEITETKHDKVKK